MTETVVTPETPPPAKAGHEDRVLPAIVYALYLLGLTHFGLTTLVGVIIAYVARDGAGPIARSHYDFLIRTFWPYLVVGLLAFAVGLVGVVLTLVLIGFPILMGAAFLLLAISVWVLVRCIVGIVYLARGEAHPRPDAPLA